MENQKLSNFTNLQSWIANHFELEPARVQLLPLNGDASFRKYYRFLVGNKSMLAVDSPPATEKNLGFVAVDYLLKKYDLTVPTIINYDLTKGFFILEDFGDKILLPILKSTDNDPEILYNKCVNELLKLQKYNHDLEKSYLHEKFNYQLPLYNQDLLIYEMEMFREWVLGKYLNTMLEPEQNELLDTIFNLLVINAYDQPQVLVHRDYHSRNLMLVEDKIAVIDFQDALLGPVTYDLVSLYRDCYVSWPISKVKQWVYDYFVQATIMHIFDNIIDFDQFWRWFLKMTLQRNFKTIAIFARLFIRDGKTNYLGDIPRTLNYALETSKILSEDINSSDSLQYQKLYIFLKDIIKPAMVSKLSKHYVEYGFDINQLSNMAAC